MTHVHAPSTSATAAARHQELLDAGPPRSGRTHVFAAASLAAGALATWSRPALSVLLGSVSAALLWVVVDDRRQSWRFRSETVAPGVPRPPAPAPVPPMEHHLVLDLTGPVAVALTPYGLVVAAAHAPTPAVAGEAVPAPRVAESVNGGTLAAPSRVLPRG